MIFKSTVAVLFLMMCVFTGLIGQTNRAKQASSPKVETVVVSNKTKCKTLSSEVQKFCEIAGYNYVIANWDGTVKEHLASVKRNARELQERADEYNFISALNQLGGVNLPKPSLWRR
jgi:hypothetical protein